MISRSSLILKLIAFFSYHSMNHKCYFETKFFHKNILATATIIQETKGSISILSGFHFSFYKQNNNINWLARPLLWFLNLISGMRRSSSIIVIENLWDNAVLYLKPSSSTHQQNDSSFLLNFYFFYFYAFVFPAC